MNRNNRIGLMVIGLIISSTLFLDSCSKKSTHVPVITSLSVDSGRYGTSVKINGTGFSTALADNQVFFNNKAAMVTAATSTELTATVPVGAGTGPVSVSIKNGERVNGPTFVYQFTAVVTTFAGSGHSGFVDGNGTGASFYVLFGITIDPSSGLIYVSDAYYIRRITPDGTVTTMAGNMNNGSSDGQGSAANFSSAGSLVTDPGGNVYIADGFKVRKMTPGGYVTTVWDYSNNTSIPIYDLVGIALDGSDNLYASDYQNNIIIKIKPDGTSAIFAGSGVAGSMDGQGTGASFHDPIDMTIDGSENIVVADLYNNKIRQVTTPGAVVTTIAGTGARGSADGPAALASFDTPDGVTVDKAGNVYISDLHHCLIRKLSPNGIVSTIAGTGKSGNPPVDGIGTAASFGAPGTLKADAAGNLYVTDYNTIRKITFK